MEKAIIAPSPQAIFRAVPSLLNVAVSKYWVDYDREADVLYISFDRPQKATDTQLTDDGLLLRYRGKKLVGVTVLEASTHREEQPQSAA